MDLATYRVRMSRTENIPVIPQALIQILAMIDKGELSPRSVQLLLEREPGLMTKLIKVANSPYYGTGNHVESVGRAIQILGTQNLRSVVNAMVMQSVTSVKPKSHLFNNIEYWKHSLAAATVCRIIGKLKMPGQCEELFTAGMLHDIGLVLIEKFEPETLQNDLRKANSFVGRSMVLAVFRVVSISLAAVARRASS